MICPSATAFRNCASRQPVVAVDRVRLHQRHDHEAAAVRERADLERGPRERASPPPACAREERERRADAGPRPRDAGDLDEPAAEQHEHEPGADRRRRGAARERVGEPSGALRPRARPARPGERQPGLHRDGGDGRAGARAAPLTHSGGEPARKSAREREDQDEARER